MTDLKEPLLPPWPSVSVAREAPCRSTMPGRPLFQGLDLLGVKKRGQGIQSWIRIDKNGSSEVLEVDKLTTMKRCDFPARDLHLLDLLFVYPSSILGRERAIVENLEQIRCIIRAHEVLLLNSMENYVLQYVAELQRCLNVRNDMVNNMWHSREQGSSLFPLVSSRQELRDDAMFGSTQSSQQKSISDAELYSGSSVDDFPFEFRVLEVALEAVCTFLDTQVVTGAAKKQSKEKTTVTNNNSSKNKSGIKARASKSQAMPSKLPPPKDEDDTLDEEEDDEHGDTLCGGWGENYASDEFWICCDNV